MAGRSRTVRGGQRWTACRRLEWDREATFASMWGGGFFYGGIAMSDNKTSAPAAEYDAHVAAVNPNYGRFHEETIDLVASVSPGPAKWLDTGCGTGTLALLASGRFPETGFTLADPSRAMLDIAAAKLAGRNIELILKGTQELDLPDGTFDVITAIQAHHYLDAGTRKDATDNCFRMLKRGGLYVTFENIRPFTDAGVAIGLDRWRRYQLGMGRDPSAVADHLARFDAEFFPINVREHLDLLRCSGFAVSEMLFMGLMQAGFYAIRQ